MPAHRADPVQLAPACRTARPGYPPATPTGRSCRRGSPLGIGFALTLLMLVEILPAVASATSVPATGRLPVDATAAERFSQALDRDGNGVEDLLDRWLAGAAAWSDLQSATAPTAGPLEAPDLGAKSDFPGQAPASTVVAAGRLRVLCLGATAGQLDRARRDGAKRGTCRVVHDLARFGGVTVLDVDAGGLAAFLAGQPQALVMLDRDGVPALVESRAQIGVGRVTSGTLDLGNDWSATVAILDSGLDSAHGDLGDAQDDDRDGPPPAVGDAGDWFPATSGWSLFAGFKVVGWHDVTDDFPASQGPWDYYYHGTALASVVAGSGSVDPAYRGVAPGARLTVVKFYDFDQVWHAWAGDFLAACAWTLDHHEEYRIRTVLTAVNWEVDAGISTAMNALVDAGLLPVAAMGNEGASPAGPGYPAVLPSVLTVGAANRDGAVSAFSSRGLSGDHKPDLVAPGGGLLPTNGRIVAADNEPDDTYSGRFGTSLAAAHVAGAACMLDEALLENGILPARTRSGVLERQAVLRLATAMVPLAENPAGTGTVPLPAYAGHDPARGFGHLRVDAAVRAVIDPLLPGQDQSDTLSSNWLKPVLGRRLVTEPGVRYLVEATPAGALDVCLEVVTIAAGDGGEQVIRMGLNGAGVSEFTYFRPDADTWSFLVVKRLSGSGSVVLRLREADSFSGQGATLALPGLGTGAPAVGNLAPFSGPSLIIPSRVLVDPIARSLNVVDLTGAFRPGWPVFVFPNSSSLGGLTQPMVANLDGVTGDEIVVASDFGSVYFFAGGGSYRTVNLDFNLGLTAPVGFQNAVGGWRVFIVDKGGRARTWSWNAAVNAAPELEHSLDLGHSVPMAPAAGRLTAGSGESLVVAFADGWLGVLDENLTLRSGWPKLLGTALEVAPVLCDLNQDGLHEIILPVRDVQSGQLTMRVFDGLGNALTADGAVVPAPRGGKWLKLSEAAVGSRYQTGAPHVMVTGLADNGMSGEQVVWSLGQACLYADGSVLAKDLQGLGIRASTDEGELQIVQALLPSPLVWNRSGGLGTEASILFHLSWQELLYGLTSLPGATTGWVQDKVTDDALVQKQPLLLGGARQAPLAHLSSLLVPLNDGSYLRVEAVDARLGLRPVQAGPGDVPLWRGQRGDERNSGSFPLAPPTVTAVPALAKVSGLQAYPNPGPGRCHFRAREGRLPEAAELEIFDLRGLLVKRIRGADSEGLMQWDGADERGRSVAAGTYLAVVRSAAGSLTTRVILTR